MTDSYIGWKLFDEVIIVAKPRFSCNYKTGETETLEDCQGYLVDPKDKKQLERAIDWATTYDYHYEYDENGNRKCTERITIFPEQFTYKNDGFELELYQCAGGSSEGGKLSFWNCWIIAPDGKKFLIGISADLLLDVLKSTTVIKGKVQEKLMFARCRGGVGMLSKTMDSYKDAIRDQETKKRVSKGKTSKHIIGHVYETATEKNIYGGKFYRWYEPIYEESSSRYWASHKELVGFLKLEKPIEYVYFPSYEKGKNKLSDYNFSSWSIRPKAPARSESDIKVEVDVTMDELCNNFNKSNILDVYDKWKNGNCNKWINYETVGLSGNNTKYTMPENIRKVLVELGYKIVD